MSGGDPYLQLKMIYPKQYSPNERGDPCGLYQILELWLYSPHERGQLGSVEVPETEDSVRYSVQAILPESQFDSGVS